MSKYMSNRKQFAIVAAVGLAAGAIVTHVVERVAYKTDLEFLGMATKMADDAVKRAQDIIDPRDDNDVD